MEGVKLEVKFTEKIIVKAINHPLFNCQTLPLSNLDLLSGRFPVTYFYFYKNSQLRSLPSSIDSLKASLAEALCYFYPFAGKAVENPTTGEPEIVCNNNGALVIQGHANIALKELDFYNLNNSFFQGKLVSVLDPNFLLQVQITSFSCGGIGVTFTFDHALGDASSFGKFLLSWSEFARKIPVSCLPNHKRNLRARCPPTYHPSLDEIFVKCTLEEIINMPTTNNITLKRLYYIDVSSISRLQELASNEDNTRTKIEAFSAYIWKIMVKTIDEKHENCKMGWLVDGRGRILIGDDQRRDYIGNVLSLATGEASVEEIKKLSLSELASTVHDAITKVTKEEHFLDLIDWIECHRPGLMLSSLVLGRGGPALVLSSGRRFPVAELDFGFGSPVLGTVCSTIEKIGVAYMNQRPSARNDGSWTISAILWPELAMALESDPIFQPMRVNHLHL